MSSADFDVTPGTTVIGSAAALGAGATTGAGAPEGGKTVDSAGGTPGVVCTTGSTGDSGTSAAIGGGTTTGRGGTHALGSNRGGSASGAEVGVMIGPRGQRAGRSGGVCSGVLGAGAGHCSVEKVAGAGATRASGGMYS